MGKMIRLEPNQLTYRTQNLVPHMQIKSALLRHPNTYPKVLILGRGRGESKAPLAKRTSVVKGQGCRFIIDQTPQEPERNLAIVPPTVKIVHMDSVQTYEGHQTLTRPRAPFS